MANKMTDMIANRIGAQPAPFHMSTTIAAPELPDHAGALPERLQDIARSYLGARRQSGVSLLEAARWLSEARAEAKHGEWAIFLEAIGLDESRARAQIRIHEEAQRDPLFADRIINGFLSETVARELLPLPAEKREELLARETPPTAQDVREAKRVVTPDLGTDTPPDLLKAGVQLVKYGAWFQAVGFSGAMNGWTNQARPYAQAAQEARAEVARRTSPAPQPSAINRPDGSPIQATPDLADMLKRLDAHGYAKSDTRTKGMTTFYSFRDYRSTLEDGQAGEIELAEGELLFWLQELDSKAAYAQAKQERYHAAKARAEALGYSLTRDGVYFVLAIPGQGMPATRGTLDQLEKTIAGYEKHAARTVVAAAPADVSDDSVTIAAIRRQAEELGMQVAWEDDQVILYWQVDDIDGLAPMSYAAALDWLTTAYMEREQGGAQQPTIAAPAAPARLMCPTCGEPILNGIWGDLKECGACYHKRQRVRPAVPPRPRRPVSADVSATVKYIGELESYASALEAFIMELQKKG